VADGVRNALDHAVDRAIGSPVAEVAYITTVVVTSAVAATLLWIGRRLSR
jgi:hypothetical protein